MLCEVDDSDWLIDLAEDAKQCVSCSTVVIGPGASMKALASRSCTSQVTLEDGFMVVDVAAITVDLDEVLAFSVAC